MNRLSDLGEENPWWSDPGAIERDQHIVAWEGSRLRCMPSVVGDFALDKDVVYTLGGARQIGKTTAAKLLIRALLGRGVRPQNILFYSCDIAGGARELYDVIREYLKHRDREKSERTFIFLDEISGVGKWQMAIRRLSDLGLLKNCTVIATGSNTAGLARSAARLPGRLGGTGEAMDKIMLPLSFLEYVLLSDKALAEKIAPALNDGRGRGKLLDSLFSGKIPPALGALSGDADALNRHLDDYATSGGIPWIIEQRDTLRAIPEDSYAAYLSLMLDGAAEFERGQEAVKGIAESLIGSIGWPVSWASLAKDMGLPNAVSALSYVSVLEDMSMLSVVHQYNTKTKSTMPGGGKKMHFADPFYFHALHGWIVSAEAYHASQKFLQDGGNRGRMVEGIVANHLIRMALRRSPRRPWFPHTNCLAYWRHGPKKKVDFVYHNGHVEVPIEVRLGQSLNKRDLDGIVAFQKASGARSGLVLTRSALSAERECLKVPAALFLLLA